MNIQPTEADFCKSHGNLFNMVCTNCHVLACPKCVEEHKQHEIKLRDAAQLYYQQYTQTANTQGLDAKIFTLQNVNQQYQENIKLLDVKEQEFIKQCQQNKNQVQEMITSYFQRKIQEFKNETSEHIAVLTRQQVQTEKIQDSIKDVRHLGASRGNLHQLLKFVKSFDSIKNQKIRQQVQYKFDMESKFNEQNLQDFQRALGNLVNFEIRNVLAEPQQMLPQQNVPAQTQQVRPQLDTVNTGNQESQQITEELLQQNNLTREDMSLIKQAIDQVKQMLPEKQFDVKVFLRKFNTYNKNIENVICSYLE